MSGANGVEVEVCNPLGRRRRRRREEVEDVVKSMEQKIAEWPELKTLGPMRQAGLMAGETAQSGPAELRARGMTTTEKRGRRPFREQSISSSISKQGQQHTQQKNRGHHPIDRRYGS